MQYFLINEFICCVLWILSSFESVLGINEVFCEIYLGQIPWIYFKYFKFSRSTRLWGIVCYIAVPGGWTNVRRLNIFDRRADIWMDAFLSSGFWLVDAGCGQYHFSECTTECAFRILSNFWIWCDSGHIVLRACGHECENRVLICIFLNRFCIWV